MQFTACNASRFLCNNCGLSIMTITLDCTKNCSALHVINSTRNDGITKEQSWLAECWIEYKQIHMRRTVAYAQISLSHVEFYVDGTIQSKRDLLCASCGANSTHSTLCCLARSGTARHGTLPHGAGSAVSTVPWSSDTSSGGQHLGDIRLDESGMIRWMYQGSARVSVYTISYHVHVYKITRQAHPHYVSESGFPNRTSP